MSKRKKLPNLSHYDSWVVSPKWTPPLSETSSFLNRKGYPGLGDLRSFAFLQNPKGLLGHLLWDPVGR